MTRPRTPRTVGQATELLASYADLDGRLAAIEGERKVALGSVNAAADAVAGPLIAEMQLLQASLEPWWAGAGQALAPNGRKSLELGGCMIGSRKTRASLTIAGAEKDVINLLSGMRWAKPFLRVNTSLNKSMLMASLDGKHRIALAELGISRSDGEDCFYIERVEQAGTMGPGA